jgi:hypothetical protein
LAAGGAEFASESLTRGLIVGKGARSPSVKKLSDCNLVRKFELLMMIIT